MRIKQGLITTLITGALLVNFSYIPTFAKGISVIVNGTEDKSIVPIVQNGKVYLPLDVIQMYQDSPMIFDNKTNTLTIGNSFSQPIYKIVDLSYEGLKLITYDKDLPANHTKYLKQYYNVLGWFQDDIKSLSVAKRNYTNIYKNSNILGSFTPTSSPDMYEYRLNKKYLSMSGCFGIDDSSLDATTPMELQIIGDNQLLYSATLVKNNRAKFFNVRLRNIDTLLIKIVNQKQPLDTVNTDLMGLKFQLLNQ